MTDQKGEEGANCSHDEEEDAPPSNLPCTEGYIKMAERMLDRDRDRYHNHSTIAQARVNNESPSASDEQQNTSSDTDVDCDDDDDVTDGMIEQLYKEIDQLPDKPTYDLANDGLRSKYIHRRDVLVKFLRAERYRPRHAADRLNRFLDISLEYFGPVGLIRPVRMTEYVNHMMK
jgi:hypothetical protein